MSGLITAAQPLAFDIPWSNDVIVLAMSVAVAVASALIPVINIEAFVMVVAGTRPYLVWPAVLAAAIGQVLGKLAIFHAARRGAAWIDRKLDHDRGCGLLQRWWPDRWDGARVWFLDTSERLLRMLDRPFAGSVVVLLSAVVGVPPLALLTIAAGARRTNPSLFAALVMAGRSIRFAGIAWPVATAAM
ncbi:MAG: hypothetical protein CSA58_01700 [Micrococcales bacterium]|nr:MAG: hypothetical protein CSA58_01700 [Micrococcales bacterium]